MLLVRSLLVILSIEAIGILLVRCILSYTETLHIAELLGLAFGLAIGLVSIGMFYLAYWQICLDTPNIIWLIFGLALILGFFNYMIRRRTSSDPSIQALERPSRRLSRLEGLLGAFICLLAIMLLLDTFSEPLKAFDARAIWGMKAKILFHKQGIYEEDFFDPDRLHAHQRYPLLIPLAECLIYRSIGSVDDRYAKALFPAFFISMNLIFYATLRRFFGRGYSMAGTALLMSLPVFITFENGGVNSGYADVPVACFCVGFVSSLFHWLCNGRAARLVIAMLFGVFLIFTKQEGLALWVLTLACISPFTLTLGRRSILKLRSLFIICLGTGVLLYPWFDYRSHLPSIDEDYFSRLSVESFSAGSARLHFVFQSFLKEVLLKPHLWNVLGPLLLVTLFLSPLRTLWLKHSVFFWIPQSYCLLICLVFLISPWKIEELVPVSLTRLLIHVAPLIVLWLFFQMETIKLLPQAWTRSD